jgi:hypothetical protein
MKHIYKFRRFQGNLKCIGTQLPENKKHQRLIDILEDLKAETKKVRHLRESLLLRDTYYFLFGWFSTVFCIIYKHHLNNVVDIKSWY